MEVNCFIADKGGVHLLILLQVQDQLSPLSHYPELSFEWMLKATTKECQFLNAGWMLPGTDTGSSTVLLTLITGSERERVNCISSPNRK